MYTSHVASFMSGISRITQFLLLTFEHAIVLRIACLFDLPLLSLLNFKGKHGIKVAFGS
jgi:hypothetical protein